MRERLFLLDGTALAYRAYFAFLRANLSDVKGRPTGAVYGFVASLLKLLEDEQPDHVGVCFDPPGKTFRDELYTEYKATRTKMDDELFTQLDQLRAVVDAFNIPVLEVPGYEADDVLATIAARASGKGIETFIVTGDKDLCQSVDEHVRIYNILKPGQDTEILDVEGVTRVWGVPPAGVVEVLALMGDSSDNIPGVPGVGKKTATKLVQEYGTVDAVLAAAAAEPSPLKGKLRERLVEHADLARLSHDLVVVRRDVPVDVSFDDLRLGPRRDAELQELFRELNFTSFLAAVSTTGKKTSEQRYAVVRTEDELHAVLERLRGAALVAWDVETTGLDPLRSELVGVSFAVEEEAAYYVPLNLEPPALGGEGDEARRRVIEALRPVLEDPAVPKCGQNTKFDMLAMRAVGVSVVGLVQDTMIASFCLDPHARQHNLDALALRHFGYRKIPTKELIGSGRNQVTMADLPVDQVGDYACEDADFTYRLAQRFAERLADDPVGDLYRDVELPLVGVLTDMEWTGVRLDVARLEEMSAEFAERIDALQHEIFEMAGQAFNVNSPKQLGEVLFERLNIQGKRRIRKTKTGYATDERTLRGYAEHPIVEKLLEYRRLSKLKSTYTDTLPALVNPRDGRVHTSYSQVGAITGRLASSDPNLQNIPIRTEDGRRIRRAFVARADGWELLSADYSQIELRILAHLSEDEHLCTAFAAGADIHTDTAARIFGIAPGLITPEIRSRAKAINFGIVYGMGATRLAQDTGITRKEATQFIDNYFRAYPGVRDYVERLKREARANGYVTTLLGRRRDLGDMLNSPQPRVQAQVDNVAVNTPIQGSAADIIKIAMLRLHDALRDVESEMILQVHDELVLDVAPGELSTVSDLVREHMENAYPMRVPLKVDMGWGPDWLTAH